MSTAARAGLPVKFFVLDDGAYHYMQMLQEPVYRRTTATEIARIDYAAFAAGVGPGLQRRSPATPTSPPGIARRSATPGPVLTRVVISYEGREIRWLNALKSTYLKHLPTDQKVRMAVAGRRPVAATGTRTTTDRADGPLEVADRRPPMPMPQVDGSIRRRAERDSAAVGLPRIGEGP